MHTDTSKANKRRSKRKIFSEFILRAPRKISAFQCFCGYEKAANLAA
jgi:hypothetical protein